MSRSREMKKRRRRSTTTPRVAAPAAHPGSPDHTCDGTLEGFNKASQAHLWNPFRVQRVRGERSTQGARLASRPWALLWNAFSVLGIVGLALTSTNADEPTRQSVFYLDADRVLVVSIELNVADKTLGTVWNHSLANFIDSIDSDKDGKLSANEAARVPTVNELRRMHGLSPQEGRPSRPFRPRSTGDPAVDLAKWLERNGFGAFGITTSAAAQANSQAANFSLFEKLDTDVDEQLTKEELAKGILFLKKFDIDSDESLSLLELRPFAPAPRMNAAAQSTGQPQEAALMVAGTSTERRALSAALLQRFDRLGEDAGRRADGKLSNRELPVSPDTFKHHDLDGNGQLDYEELGQFARQPYVSASLVVDVSQDSERPVSMKSESPRLKLIADRPGGRRAKLFIGDKVLELVVGGMMASQDTPAIQAEFNTADADGNGYITQAESTRVPNLSGLFRLMDEDGDGNSFLEEFSSFVRTRHAFQGSRVVMSAGREGRNLFEIIDADKNVRLSFAELDQLPDLFSGWDANGDQSLDQAELPSNYRLTIGAMESRGDTNSSIVVSAEDLPLWFQRMDRNEDGRVTFREFVGPIEKFRELDTDADDVLSPTEAQ